MTNGKSFDVGSEAESRPSLAAWLRSTRKCGSARGFVRLNRGLYLASGPLDRSTDAAQVAVRDASQSRGISAGKGPRSRKRSDDGYEILRFNGLIQEAINRQPFVIPVAIAEAHKRAYFFIVSVD